MLTSAENETLVRVGPGTPMGELMRRYWMPALLSRELPEADCPPVRVRLLGERLVAFRDTAGRVGLLSEFCAHRGASLWFGRNEEGGLRCVFHGWKYDVDGTCLDMMNEPDAFDFKQKVHLRAYPVVESGGLVWAFMGPPGRRPPPPEFGWTQVPEAHRYVDKTWEECSWLQGLEGGLDTSHVPILHRRLREGTGQPGINPSAPLLRGRAPEVVVETTDYGYRYFGVRELEAGEVYVRGYHFVMPFTQIRPGADFTGGDLVAGHMWAPMDDENTMVYNWEYSLASPMEDPQAVARELGSGPGEIDERFRKARNRDNDYRIDRGLQRTDTFTGIFGVNTQDHAIQESMGPIADRTLEQLGQADKAIIAARKLLLDAAQTVADGGEALGAEAGVSALRAADRVIAPSGDWHAEMLAEMHGDGA